MQQYRTIQIVQKNPNSWVFHLYLNRPSRRNSISRDFFTEFPDALSSLDQNPDARVIVLCGAGNHFCSGIDLETFKSITDKALSGERGLANEWLRREIMFLQNAITAIDRCRKPVIASIQGACIGAGVDLVAACDIRFCTQDSFFSVKEIDLGLAADLGTLQRLPAVVGYGNAMELALMGRNFSGEEAKQLGLVSRVFGSKEELDEGVKLVAKGIAAKSPLAVIGTKAILLKSKELNVEQGLDYAATWNSAMLISNDLTEAVKALIQKRNPIFAKL